MEGQGDSGELMGFFFGDVDSDELGCLSIEPRRLIPFACAIALYAQVSQHYTLVSRISHNAAGELQDVPMLGP
jgi:hypothetical protein